MTHREVLGLSAATIQRYCRQPVPEVYGIPHHPHDAGDLARCLRYLDTHPEAAKHFPTVIPTLSEHWTRLAAIWPHLTDTLLSEVPGVLDMWSAEDRAPRTTRLITEALRGA